MASKLNRWLSILAATALAGWAVLPSHASAAFGYYSPVTVNAGQVPSTQTNYPERIFQTDARLKTVANGGYVQNPNGYDIRPYTDSGGAPGSVITDYELVYYDGTNGTVEMYVKRSSLAVGTVTQLTYGDSSLTTDDSSTSTWSNSFIFVFHAPNGSSLSLRNSVTGLNGTNGGGAQACTATTGFIDGGAAFASANNQFFDVGSFQWPASFTYSIWSNSTSLPGAYNPTIFFNIGPNTAYAALYVKSNGKLAWFTNHSSYDGTGSHTLSNGTWYYLAATYDSSTGGTAGFVNAASDGSGSGSTGVVTTGTQDIIIGQDSVNAFAWNGKLDEMRMASVKRSTDWITVEYNEGFPATFETLGAQVAVSTGNTSNFFQFFPR